MPQQDKLKNCRQPRKIKVPSSIYVWQPTSEQKTPSHPSQRERERLILGIGVG